MENVDEYSNYYLSRRWIFRKEIQITLAEISSLEHVTRFRKSMLYFI
jgi:hypothetical protein